MLSPSSAAAPGPHGGSIGPSGSMGCSRLVTGPTESIKAEGALLYSSTRIDLKWAVAHVYLDEDIIDREQTEESYNGLGRPRPLGSFYTQTVAQSHTEKPKLVYISDRILEVGTSLSFTYGGRWVGGVLAFSCFVDGVESARHRRIGDLRVLSDFRLSETFCDGSRGVDHCNHHLTRLMDSLYLKSTISR
jgi:hypothetical protein